MCVGGPLKETIGEEVPTLMRWPIPPPAGKVDSARFNARRRYGQRQAPVLVDVINAVDSQYGVIPSIRRIYLIEDDVSDAGIEGLYMSCDGLFERHSRSGDWEVPFGVVPSANAPDFPCNVVEGRSQVMGNVPDNCGDNGWGSKGLKVDVLDKFLRIEILPDARLVSVDKMGNRLVELSNVLVGPFNL